jgi:type VI secretion system secreted protein VgrG
VSQQWAGGGFGGQYTPRVGHEVLVAYLEGDPERPVIVGRVYNGANRAPFRVDEHKLRSTLRSDSSHNDSNRPADGSNEIRFEDRKGGEQIYVHAQMDLDEVVENDHTTAVERDQKNTVKRDQFNTVERNRQQKVLGWEEVTTQGDRRTEFLSNETHTVKKDRTTVVGENERLHVIGRRDAEVNGTDTRTVHQDDTVRIGGQRHVETGNNQYVLTRGLYDSRATANHEFRSSNIYFVTGPFDGDGASGDIQAKSATLRFWQNEQTAFHARKRVLIHVGSSTVTVEPGLIRLGIDGGASISLSGGAITINATAGLTINGRTVQMHATGGGMTLDASQDVNIEGKGGYTTVKGTPSVKLNP